MRRIVFLWFVVGCSGDKTAATGGTGDTAPGTTSTAPASLSLDFDLKESLISLMSEPATGKFEGSIYAEADFDGVGNELGPPLLDFESDPLDFGTAGGTLTAGAVVGPLDVQVVWIVGCLDTTGDGCECADPITIPNENKMQLVSGGASYTVKMSLLNPTGC